MMKKITGILSMMALALCMALALGVSAEAKEVKVAASLEEEASLPNVHATVLSKDYFQLYSYDISEHTCRIVAVLPDSADYMQVQLQNASKQTIKTLSYYRDGYRDFSSSKITKNKIFYYRARAHYSSGWGEWSYRRAFSTCKATVSKAGTFKFKVKAPKVTGVKKYQIFMSSTSSSKGFKSVGYLKPGASKTISSFNGKSIKSYGTYHKFYFFLKPYLNSGSTDGVYLRDGYYFY